MPYGNRRAQPRRYYKKKVASAAYTTTTTANPFITGSKKSGLRKSSLPSTITVVHTSAPSVASAPVSNQPQLTPEQQALVRETYRKCLEHAAQSGKFMTKPLRQSLQTAIMTEVALQQQSGQQASPQPSGSPTSPNQSMTTAELVSLLQQRLSISGSSLPHSLPQPATNISA